MAVKRFASNLPGPRLKAYRNALGITLREVEAYSRHIANVEGNSAFIVSHSYLSALEGDKKGIPSFHKLFVLSVLYRIRLCDLLRCYGVDLENISKFEMDIRLPRTHLIWHDVYAPDRSVAFPVRFDPGFNLKETEFFTRIIETWGEIPIGFIQHLGIQKRLYGFIGTEDFTLYPIIRPGSIVSIDDSDTKIELQGWSDTFERPIYFLQLRKDYACGWCQVTGDRLSLIPCSTGFCSVREFNYPAEVAVVGRVVGVAMALVDPQSKLPPDVLRTRRQGDDASSTKSICKETTKLCQTH